MYIYSREQQNTQDTGHGTVLCVLTALTLLDMRSTTALLLLLDSTVDELHSVQEQAKSGPPTCPMPHFQCEGEVYKYLIHSVVSDRGK